MLTLKRTYESPSVGPWSYDGYDLFDGDRHVGRIMLVEQTPEGQRWFWTTARVPQSTHDYGYAASREQAIADFKVRWGVISSPNTSNSSLRVSTGPINGQDAMNRSMNTADRSTHLPLARRRKRKTAAIAAA
jgi:hypothetical protein